MYTIDKVETLSKKFVIDSEGCWNWTGAKTEAGYGTCVVNYKQKSAHRHLYQAVFGEVSKDLQLDHLCRNRLCVNPKHLEPVSQLTNIMRGQSFSAKNATKTHCRSGHEFTQANTYIRLRNGVTHRDCRACRRLAVNKYQVNKEKENG